MQGANPYLPLVKKYQMFFVIRYVGLYGVPQVPTKYTLYQNKNVWKWTTSADNNLWYLIKCIHAMNIVEEKHNPVMGTKTKYHPSKFIL